MRRDTTTQGGRRCPTRPGPSRASRSTRAYPWAMPTCRRTSTGPATRTGSPMTTSSSSRRRPRAAPTRVNRSVPPMSRRTGVGRFVRSTAGFGLTVKIASGWPKPRAERCFAGAMSPGQSRYRGWLLVASAAVPLLVAALLSLVRDNVSAAAAVLVLVLVVVAASSTGVRSDRAGGRAVQRRLCRPVPDPAVRHPRRRQPRRRRGARHAARRRRGRDRAGPLGPPSAGRVEPHAPLSRRVLSTAEKVAARDPDAADLVAVVTTELTGLLGWTDAGMRGSHLTCG